MTRRQIVKSAGAGVGAAALRRIDRARAQDSTRAVEEGKGWGRTKGITVDWARLADENFAIVFLATVKTG